MKLNRRQLRRIIAETLNTQQPKNIHEGLFDAFNFDNLEDVIDKLEYILPDAIIEKLRNALDIYTIVNPSGEDMSADDMSNIKARLDIPDVVKGAPDSAFDVDAVIDKITAEDPNLSIDHYPEWKKDAVKAAISKLGTQGHTPVDFAKDIGSIMFDKRN
tara:strand:- start:39 stop:515 length:477 start_codon:yes stop_codon:yes gene_type:complete